MRILRIFALLNIDTMKNKKSFIALSILLVIMGLLFSGCHSNNPRHKEGDIEILRFEQEMLSCKPEQLYSHLKEIKPQFASNLLFILPDDPKYMEQAVGFSQDPVVRDIYDTVQKYYKHLYWLESSLTSAFANLEKAGMKMNYNKFITFISAAFDYDNRVAADGNSLLISIDQYVLPHMEKYGYFSTPMYMVSMCDSAFLPVDCMIAAAQQQVQFPETEPTMLDLMIAEGKTLYILDIAFPKMDDRLKIRYTEDQFKWMTHSEADVWAFFIQNKMLFETDYNKFHNFVDEAPKTNAFKDSAPRTADYIGWQIVRRYVKKTGCNLVQLMEETNSQKILQESGYRP